MNGNESDDMSTVTAAEAPPADRLAAAAATLRSPCKALHLDAAVSAILALLDLRDQDAAATAGVILALRETVRDLADTAADLTDRIGPVDDGR